MEFIYAIVNLEPGLGIIFAVVSFIRSPFFSTLSCVFVDLASFSETEIFEEINGVSRNLNRGLSFKN